MCFDDSRMENPQKTHVFTNYWMKKDVKPQCFHKLLPENATQTPCFIDFCMQQRMKRHVFSDFCLIRRWDQPLWSYDWSQIIKFICFAGAPWKTDSNIVIGHRLQKLFLGTHLKENQLELLLIIVKSTKS